MQFLVLAACLCTAAAAGPAAAVQDEVGLVQAQAALHSSQARPAFWAGKNGNLLRTGASRYLVPSNLKSGPAWSFHEKGNGLIRAAPLIDSEYNIYLATIPGNVYKMNPHGKVLWKYSANRTIPCVPALMDGAIFAGTDEGRVFALDTDTGRQLWSTKVAQSIGGDTWSVTAAEGVVVVPGQQQPILAPAGGGNRVLALDAKDGSKKWSFTPGDMVYNFLSAVHQGSLVFSDLTGRAYRLKLESGDEIWRTERAKNAAPTTGGAVVGPNGIVYVTSNLHQGPSTVGKVSALTFSKGQLLWEQTVGLPANNAAAVGLLGEGPLASLGVVIGVGANPSLPGPVSNLLRALDPKPGKVIALNALTGKPIWSYNMPTWQGAAAGDTLSHVCLPDSFGNPAIGGDGTVYIGFENGKLYAIRDGDGDGQINERQGEASSYSTGNAFQGSPAIAPGMLVATPCNAMHVFRSGEKLA